MEDVRIEPIGIIETCIPSPLLESVVFVIFVLVKVPLPPSSNDSPFTCPSIFEIDIVKPVPLVELILIIWEDVNVPLPPLVIFIDVTFPVIPVGVIVAPLVLFPTFVE